MVVLHNTRLRKWDIVVWSIVYFISAFDAAVMKDGRAALSASPAVHVRVEPLRVSVVLEEAVAVVSFGVLTGELV